MLDINLIRNEPEMVKAAIASRYDDAPIDEILAGDERRRAILQDVEALRRQRNESSKAIGQRMGRLKKKEAQLEQARRRGDDQLAELEAEIEALRQEAEEAKETARIISEQIPALDEELREVEASLHSNMLWVPNIPHSSVPVGPDESYNVAHEMQGAPLPEFDFEPKPHWELGEALDIIDFERGVKLSGSRFYLLKGMGARLQHAVIQFMLMHHTQQNGYTEVYPPFIARSINFETAAQLPKFFDNIYRDAEEDFMLLGTAEIALTNVHRDEILPEADLPIKYVAYSPCFRREKMSAGKDVRGIKRGHQFDKVELYQYTHPDNSYETLDTMLQQAIGICDLLGFPYRVVDLATSDISMASAKTYDIEIWAAGCQEWLEVSSASNCLDFQARRANVRYRPEEGSGTRFPHTLNASGLALPRVIIGILENNQQADGSVIVPEVLRAYMGGVEVIEP